MTNVTAALEAFIPTLTDRFVAQVERLFAAYTDRFGPTFRGIYNSECATNYKNMVAPFVRKTGIGAMNDPYALNNDRVAAAAAEYAKATVAAWEAKIAAKLGELENAELVRGAGNTFMIKGTKNGMTVAIEQDMIINVSSKGTLFNQFPARIYVNGKFMSAAKFAAL